MYCEQCGTQVQQGMQYCTRCSASMEAASPSMPRAAAIEPGFSSRIGDPAFDAYVRRSSKISILFGLGMTILSFAGFTIYGVVQDRLVFGLFLAILIGGIFLVTTLVTLIRSRTGGTWDGTIVDKKVKKRRRAGQKSYSSLSRTYKEYILYIKKDDGKMHKHAFSHAAAVYDYYQVGDRVRRHPGLQFFEKYDKSQDAEILCNACLRFNPSYAEVCGQCKCPVLK